MCIIVDPAGGSLPPGQGLAGLPRSYVHSPLLAVHHTRLAGGSQRMLVCRKGVHREILQPTPPQRCGCSLQTHQVLKDFVWAMLDKVVVAVQNAVKLPAKKAVAELDERTPAWTKYVTDKAMNEELVKEDLVKNPNVSKLPELIKNARRCKSSFDVMLAAAGSRKASKIPALSKALALWEGSCEQAGRTVSAKAAANVVLNMADKPNGPAMAASVISLLGTTKLPLVLHEALVKLSGWQQSARHCQTCRIHVRRPEPQEGEEGVNSDTQTKGCSCCAGAHIKAALHIHLTFTPTHHTHTHMHTLATNRYVLTIDRPRARSECIYRPLARSLCQLRGGELRTV